MSLRIVVAALGLVALSIGSARLAEPRVRPLGGGLADEPQAASSAAEDPDRVDYNFDVKPILSRRCFSCHGFDPSTREAKLRLDEYASATADRRNGAIIVPGQPETSRLIERVIASDPEDRMPPVGHPALEPDEVETLRRWIAQGANYAPHWSWTPLDSGPVPTARDTAWPRDSVDHFIAVKREAAGLTPADEADRATWLRRVTFDVTGLPPTVEELDAFLSDTSPNAHSRIVDRLLASPHYGERWGRHWLDLMRYAETYGHEFDYPIPHAYQYRDYVIRAFNADVRYDELVTEHLAGDLVEEPRRHPAEGFNESIIGTGFWFLHQGTHAPTDVRKDEAERIDNQIDVMTKSFLATTVSCARCHDHKFDAIPTSDYYALMGFLQSSRQREVAVYPQDAEPIFDQLNRERDRGQRILATISPAASGRQVAVELKATHDAIFGEGYAPFEPRPPIVFEDFESELAGRWTIEGDAFAPDLPDGSGDSIGEERRVTGFKGSGFVRTHESYDLEQKKSISTDNHAGKLISAEFTIERSRISFLISGGNHPDKTCVQLVSEGKVVRSVTGHNSNAMRPAHMDVRELEGKTARLEVVDDHRQGWGHIGIDHIVFEDVPPPLTAVRDLTVVGQEYAVDPKRLESWIELLGSPEIREKEHPLYPWYGVTLSEEAKPGDLSTRLGEIAADLARTLDRHAQSSAPKYKVFEDFDDDLSEWFESGEAWRTTRAGDWREADGHVFLESAGLAHSGSTSRRLRGSLRSATFVVESKHIHYRVAGRGRIRLIIEGYTLDRFNPLLFNGASIDVDTGGRQVWQQQAQDVEDHIGHRAYIELSDDGDEWLAVDEIRFSDEKPPRLHPEPVQIELLAEVTRVDTLADAYGRAITIALTEWQAGTIDPGSKVLLDSLSKRDLLPLPSDLATILRERQRAEAALPEPRLVLAIDDGTPEEQPIYIRGSHSNLGDEVHRRFLTELSKEQSGIVNGSGRLELAQRLLDARNPLTARVIVNRVWQHLFDRGIVATPDDFGALGRLPTHPRLLDHLAEWFRTDANWSIKRLIRRLVLTSTYRMSSSVSDAANSARIVSRDPNNDLFHAMRTKRLEGEAIRDAILAVSGRLDRTLFGPSIPIHLTPFLQGRGRPSSGPLDGHGRRSIYLSVYRNFMSPMLQAFDAPVPMTTIGRRNRSNVPAQALTLMNDPFVHEQALTWARTLLAETPEADRPARVARLFRQALSRPPSAREHALCETFLIEQAKLREVGPQDERVWADLTHVIFNMKDFVFLR